MQANGNPDLGGVTHIPVGHLSVRQLGEGPAMLYSLSLVDVSTVSSFSLQHFPFANGIISQTLEFSC